MKNGFYASTHPAYYNGKLKCNCGQLLDTFDSFYEHINNHNNLTWAYDLLPVQQFKRLLHDKIKVLTGQEAELLQEIDLKKRRTVYSF